MIVVFCTGSYGSSGNTEHTCRPEAYDTIGTRGKLFARYNLPASAPARETYDAISTGNRFTLSTTKSAFIRSDGRIYGSSGNILLHVTLPAKNGVVTRGDS